jgi:hypothetical protein
MHQRATAGAVYPFCACCTRPRGCNPHSACILATAAGLSRLALHARPPLSGESAERRSPVLGFFSRDCACPSFLAALYARARNNAHTEQLARAQAARLRGCVPPPSALPCGNERARASSAAPATCARERVRHYHTCYIVSRAAAHELQGFSSSNAVACRRPQRRSVVECGPRAPPSARRLAASRARPLRVCAGCASRRATRYRLFSFF